ncbi:plasmid mobilization relaxosome protein MobC [Streptomyces sp. NRRL S-87]|uniref:plasmid mobilization protein n=1 Tax=Streptomyces sp. NRRL S-87 TaxID=1463920 RepID=UPI00099DDD11|nr:plasmid mobilization relaxosome protein MobC [Streptomyces sp. NRRL S-87]
MAEPAADETPARRASRRREREAGGARETRIKVSFNDDEHDLVKAAAERARQATASWIGRLSVEVAEEIVVPLPSSQRALIAELIEARRQLKRIGVNYNQIAKVLNSDGEVTDEEMTSVHRALVTAIRRLDEATLQLMRERRDRT